MIRKQFGLLAVECTRRCYAVLILLLSALPAWAQVLQDPPWPETVSPVRAPAYPLVTHDPYFSIWSFSDQLAGDWTRHWTGRNHALTSMVRIDGVAYRLMGMKPVHVAAMEQRSVHVTPTRTIYSFTNGQVELRLIFQSPVIASRMEWLARPVSYLIWQVKALDGKPHHVEIYFDNSAELVVNSTDQPVVWSRVNIPGVMAQRLGSKAQPILKRAGDLVSIDWGYLYQAVAQQPGLVQAIAADQVVRERFAAGQGLPQLDDNRMPRAAHDQWPVLATSFDLGMVNEDWSERYLILAYDDLYSVEHMGEWLKPYWRRAGAEASDLIALAIGQFAEISKASEIFDARLVQDLTRVGGHTFARVAILAYRQSVAGHKLVAAKDGSPIFFSKENSSNGCMATVDVTYPGAPLFLLLNPELVKAMVTPILDYASSSRWRFPFAPHDIGIYPKANGQAYGGGELSEQDQMPVEESGNMLILMAAISHAENTPEYARRYWPVLTRWAEYLKNQGFDPANQLSTEDFSGHLAHNANLSVKAIIALGAYSDLARKLGLFEQADIYRAVAEDFVQRWIVAANDGDHSRLAFDRPGTWSQKYNLVWDQILDLKLFPAEVFTREINYYRQMKLGFGLPLDNRATYTILPSMVWSFTLGGNSDDFAELMAPLDEFLDHTPDRVPLSDWYDTATGRRTGFQARSVVGGVYLPMLYDRDLWRWWLAQIR